MSRSPKNRTTEQDEQEHPYLARITGYRPTPMPEREEFPEIYEEREYKSLEAAKAGCQEATNRLWADYYGYDTEPPPPLVWVRVEDNDQRAVDWYEWSLRGDERGYVGTLDRHCIWWNVLEMPLRSTSPDGRGEETTNREGQTEKISTGLASIADERRLQSGTGRLVHVRAGNDEGTLKIPAWIDQIWESGVSQIWIELNAVGGHWLHGRVWIPENESKRALSNGFSWVPFLGALVPNQHADLETLESVASGSVVLEGHASLSTGES